MKPSDVGSALELCVKLGQPAHVWGPPGVGKTAITGQVAKKLKHELLVTRLSQIESVDLRGLPVVDEKAGTTRWLVPAEFPRQGCKPTVWFFDEWSQGLPSVQNAAGQLLNERQLGDYKLPDNVVILGASNRAQDRAATNRMPSQIADRFFHLYMDVSVEDWVKWALKAGVPMETIAFIRFRPNLLSAFDPIQNSSPSPRGWEKVGVITAAKPDPKIELPLYAGKIGDGAAAEYVGFLKIYRNLPDIDAVLLNPDKAVVPDDPATKYAIAGALARKASDANFDRVVKYVERMGAEFSVLAVTQAVAMNPKVQSTRAFTEWAVANHEILV